MSSVPAVFRFTEYSYDPALRTAAFSYAFDETFFFTETVRFPEPLAGSALRRDAFDRLLYLTHLALGISYYKAFVPANVQVETKPPTAAEAEFFTAFYRLGLSEFAYRNNMKIPFALTGNAPEPDFPGASLPQRLIVPVGGGKDSSVTLEALKCAGFSPVAASVGLPKPIEECIRISGLPSFAITRTVSKTLLDLNSEKGVLNGHVPITGMFAFILALASVLIGFDTVVMSNERSANTGNVKGENVNHQWSKSVEFERSFIKLLAPVLPPFKYFSLLRPYSELAIARKFASLTPYHDSFTSCNRAFHLDPKARLNHWCGICDKCRFVFLALAPYMPASKLSDIFGKNLLDDPAQEEGYRELLGFSGHKPFECVGEQDECALAFLLTADKGKGDAPLLVKKLLPEIAARFPAKEALMKTVLTPAASPLIPLEFKDALAFIQA